MTDSYIARWKARVRGVGVTPPPPPPPPPATPDATWSKADIITWLAGAGIDVDAKAQRTLSKDELLELVADVLDEETP